MAENPYQAPKTDVNATVARQVVQPRVKMPRVVLAAVILASITALLSIVGLNGMNEQFVMYVSGIYVLIIFGLVRGHALAWQWGIVIPSLVVVLLALSLLWLSQRTHLRIRPSVLGTMIGSLLLYLSIPVLLSFRASRIFFGLQCPQCGQVRGRAASFTFTKRRCAACKFEWTPVRR